MQAVLPIVGGLVGLGAGLLTGKPKTPPVPPPITRNDAAAQASADRTYRTRLGAGANEITRGGAEAPTSGGKMLLGQ
jgi:hypothetical protein